MAATPIQWCDYTFNPWWGCARVSPGCRFCYADTTAQRWGHHELWLRRGPRRVLSDQYWRAPLRWNRTAAAAGSSARVFSGSMCDVFEIHPQPDVAAVLDAQRARLWELIAATPYLTWQLLTKRPENITKLAPWDGDWPRNVWVGASVEDQRRAAERIPVLAEVPAVVRFLSCEPLVAPVDLGEWLASPCLEDPDGLHHQGCGCGVEGNDPEPQVDWCIVGGESGRKARPMELDWAWSLVRQCRQADVPVFVKQLGSVWAKGHRDSMGGNPYWWPAELDVREFPAEEP